MTPIKATRVGMRFWKALIDKDRFLVMSVKLRYFFKDKKILVTKM